MEEQKRENIVKMELLLFYHREGKTKATIARGLDAEILPPVSVEANNLKKTKEKAAA